MVRHTMIARAQDGLPLAEGLDAGDQQRKQDLGQWKQQAKQIFKRVAQSRLETTRMSVDSAPFVFHYLIEGGVCYLTLADRAYPKKLAFQYLDELQSEFSRLYGPQIAQASRPYAFIKFDLFIQKTAKLYSDSRTQRNIAKLNDDLQEVHSVMTRNIADVLGQGERLDRMAEMSAALTQESRQYANRARDLQRQALIRKYTPLAVVVGVVTLVLVVRYIFYT